jgi:hypothetical protein
LQPKNRNLHSVCLADDERADENIGTAFVRAAGEQIATDFLQIAARNGLGGSSLPYTAITAASTSAVASWQMSTRAPMAVAMNLTHRGLCGKYWPPPGATTHVGRSVWSSTKGVANVMIVSLPSQGTNVAPSSGHGGDRSRPASAAPRAVQATNPTPSATPANFTTWLCRCMPHLLAGRESAAIGMSAPTSIPTARHRGAPRCRRQLPDRPPPRSPRADDLPGARRYPAAKRMCSQPCAHLPARRWTRERYTPGDADLHPASFAPARRELRRCTRFLD